MAWPIAFAVLLGACSFGLVGEVSGPRPDLPGCDQANEFAFIGETSLGAIGLGESAGLEGARVGTVWVTADKVQIDMGRPGLAADPTRMMCVQWADGSGMSGPVPDDWQPPVAAVSSSTSLPIAPLVVAVVLASLVGVSYLAFRRERPADA